MGVSSKKASFDELKGWFDQGKCQKIVRDVSDIWLKQISTPYQNKGYWYLGQCHEKLGHPDKALATYQVGVQLYPQDKELLLALANLFHRVELDREARALFESLLLLDPAHLQANIGLAESYKKLGLLDKALIYYEAASKILKPGKADGNAFWLEYADVLCQNGQWEAAENSIRKILESSPNAEAWVRLGKIQRAQRQKARSLESLEQAQKLDPERLDIQLMYSLWLEADGHHNRSLQAIQAILKRDPFNPLAHWILAWHAMKSGKPAESLQKLSSLSEQQQSPFLAQVSAAMKLELQKRTLSSTSSP